MSLPKSEPVVTCVEGDVERGALPPGVLIGRDVISLQRITRLASALLPVVCNSTQKE